MNMRKQITIAAAVCVAVAFLPSMADEINVPLEYKPVAYIQSSAQQFIDTGIMPDENTSLKLDFMMTAYNSASVLFGTTWDWHRWNLRIYGWSSRPNSFEWFGNNTVLGAFVSNKRMRLAITVDGRVVMHDYDTGNVQYGPFEGQDLQNTSNTNLALFGSNNLNDPRRCSMRLYRCTMTTNSVPARDFIPVLRVADNVPGLYDQVSGGFFTNGVENGVAFTYGEEVPKHAYWIATGNETDISSPANWRCTDWNGAAMPGALPGNFTTVHIPGAVTVQSPRGNPLACAKVVFEDNATLSADSDWRGLKEESCIEGHLALNGHRLLLSNAGGSGVIGPHSGYERLEYIQSSNAQCIRTGIVPGENTALQLDFMMTAYTSAAVLFGTGKWGSECWHLRTYVRNRVNSFEWFGTGSGTALGDFIQNKRLHLAITTDRTITISNQATGDVVYGPFTGQSLKNNNNAELTLFGFQDGDRRCSMRVYGCKIWQDGGLVRNFSPARRLSDGTVGLYDDGEGVFHENVFETPFVAGPALSTDDSAGGTVWFEVPDKTTASSSVAIRGAACVVKDGAGTLESVTAETSYLGGTFISNGLMRASVAHSLGCAADVLVAPNGVIDMRGNNMNEYSFVLDGGTVSNTVGQGATAIQLKTMRLTADSKYYTTGSYGFSAPDLAPTTLDLGGHTLSAYIGSGQFFTLINTTVTNGVIRMITGGHIRPYTTSSYATSVDMSTVDLEILNCAIRMDADMDVRDYVSRYQGNYNYCSGKLAVYGTFTPASRYFYGCTLQDGATLDLSEWPADLGWPMYSRFTTGDVEGRTLKFADGANVTVNLAGREDVKSLAKNGISLLKWGDTAGTLTKKPVGVIFMLDETSALHYRLKSNDTGLLLSAPRGLMILVR